ncbi:peptide methionine sulfoxide reductase [Acrasis kona]|uniref:peptide-methionine (S)-S-oxide reductase n=1 Tax=Acrasis kona TaxID=1008807 RepID=A0AAW2Z3Q4_9EUKA
MSLQKVAFGAGCFWGTEKFFVKQFAKAINQVKVGYMGGSSKNPSYRDVCTGQTGHAEVLYLEYKPEEVKFEDLVEYFFRMHDPTTLNRQGNDQGTQYRSAIFYYTEEQKAAAEKVKKDISSKVKGEIVTEIAPASEFYVAEDYHQKYLENNPGGYCNHRLRW